MTHILPDTKALDQNAGLLGDVIRGEFGLTPDQRARVLRAANEAAADAMMAIFELQEEQAGDEARKVQAGFPASADTPVGPRTLATIEIVGRVLDSRIGVFVVGAGIVAANTALMAVQPWA